jgi:hypothetical protein
MRFLIKPVLSFLESKRGALILKSEHGGSMIFPVVLVMSLVIIMGGMLEFFRMQIIAQGVREAVKAAVLAVASNNSEAIFGGVREGYSGAYELAGEDWKGTLNEGDVYEELDGVLGLTNLGVVHTRNENGKVSFSVTDLVVTIRNAPFAAESNAQQMQIQSEITLIVPMQFGGHVLPEMKSRLTVSSGFISKY